MHHFTPVSAIIGGALIGIAAAMMLVLNGRIAGVSGIVGSLLKPADGERGWRMAFVAGLVAGPLLVPFVSAFSLLLSLLLRPWRVGEPGR